MRVAVDHRIPLVRISEEGVPYFGQVQSFIRAILAG
ncbi:MAG: hypothetical protein USCGTAYLOR_00945 [Chromatiales bacterium USCg_Taylor]|nr:MAG: hypothetical protein USCGTAYLOR_00945 [Chromatiales bacterium USCg_Taylor]